MANRGKRYNGSRAKVDPQKKYELDEGIELLKEGMRAKFDETIEIAINLGVDPRKADQLVRGAVVLPHGTGKEVRVLVFAKGEKAEEAKEAGADYVGGEDYAEKIQKDGWLEFDRCIATPDMMKVVGKLGRVLGPRSLMPNPKVGTVTFDVGPAVKAVKGGRIEFRVEKAGIIQTRVGKASFEKEHLRGNILALIETLLRLKPQTAKGQYIEAVAISSTMGPGIRLDATQVQQQVRL